ncbi:MAG TPA: SGNH/GDSL hydrolase family protein, partial [Bacillota bacterium]|nr:SGNH/GDSL hydrolase family protein [Bacillota bacterium]
MNSSSSLPVAGGTRVPSAEPSVWLKLLPFLAAGLLMLSFLTIPRPPPGDEVQAYEADPSLSLILDHAHQHGLQFGTQHVYTYGPLGFLVFFFHSPQTAGMRMTVDIVFSFTVALGLCLVAWRLRPLWGGLLLALFVWVAANTETNLDLLLNAGLFCWGVLAFVESGRRLTAAALVFTLLALFCALAKISFLFVAGLSVVLLACDLWVRAQRRLAAGIVAGFGAGFLGGWMLLGQHLRHLPACLLNALAMVRGYNAALGWETSTAVSGIGWVLALLLAALVLLRTLRLSPNWLADCEAVPERGLSSPQQRPNVSPLPHLLSPTPEPVTCNLQPATCNARLRLRRTMWRRAFLLAWIAGLTFAAWKHGFVRAHPCNIQMAFGFLAVVALALDLVPCDRPGVRRWTQGIGLGCCLLTAITFQCSFFPPLLESLLRPVRSVPYHLRCLLQPAEYYRQMNDALAANRRQAQLPQFKELIGRASADVFGRRQAYALLNDLNYRPRPVPQSYAVCNAKLMRLNEQFYLSGNAPEFVLFELDSFDRKFPPLEDAWLLRNLLINYRLVAEEGRFLLLKSRASDAPRLTLLRASTAQPGQPIDLREFGDANLWLEVDLQPTWLGRLRQFFIRPPTVRLAAWREPAGKLLCRNRAPDSMLAAGLLASPLLLRNSDVANLYTTHAATRPGAYSVELLPGEAHYWQNTIRVRVYRIENPLGNGAPVSPGAPASLPASASSHAVADSKVSARPFTLFRSARWRPTQAPPGNFEETLAFGLSLLLPCASVGGLLLFAVRVKQGRAPAGWAGLLLGNGLVLLCLLSTALVAGEAYFRFGYDTTDSLAYTRVCERWVQRHWQVNAAGCRDDVEYAPAIAPGKRRLSFVGDSFTAGHGIKKVADRFPNRLRQAHPDWEIHVLANVGLDTGAETILLNKAFTKGYQVDQVVLVYCLNDIGDLLPPDTFGAGQLVVNSENAPWLVRNSYLINFLYYRYQAA